MVPHCYLPPQQSSPGKNLACFCFLSWNLAMPPRPSFCLQAALHLSHGCTYTEADRMDLWWESPSSSSSPTSHAQVRCTLHPSAALPASEQKGLGFPALHQGAEELPVTGGTEVALRANGLQAWLLAAGCWPLRKGFDDGGFTSRRD